MVFFIKEFISLGKFIYIHMSSKALMITLNRLLHYSSIDWHALRNGNTYKFLAFKWDWISSLMNTNLVLGFVAFQNVSIVHYYVCDVPLLPIRYCDYRTFLKNKYIAICFILPWLNVKKTVIWEEKIWTKISSCFKQEKCICISCEFVLVSLNLHTFLCEF